MTKGLVRYQKCGVFHFLTFSCYRRMPLLGMGAAYSVFEREFEAVRLRYGFVVGGWPTLKSTAKVRVPHSSLFSGEGWETTNLNRAVFPCSPFHAIPGGWPTLKSTAKGWETMDLRAAACGIEFSCHDEGPCPLPEVRGHFGGISLVFLVIILISR
jgi:hypothetical protein